MTGFLTRIAARLSGSEGMLRPRIPSLFEPVATVAVDPPVTSLQVEHTDALQGADEINAGPTAKSSALSGDARSNVQRSGAPAIKSNAAAFDRRPTSEREVIAGEPVARTGPPDRGGQAQPACMV